MKTEPESVRARLLAIDPIDASERHTYEAALRELFDKKLSRARRLRYLVPTIGGFVMAAGLSTLALTEPASTPLGTRVVLLALAGIGAFWFVVCGRILRRGSVDLRRDERTVALAALAFTTLQALFFAWGVRTDAAGLPALVVSLVFVLLAATLFLAQRIRASELRVREHLLRGVVDRTEPE